jgi:hypothetical protein
MGGPTNAERGLPDRDEEDIGAAADEIESEIGCDRLPYFDSREALTDQEIRRLYEMSGLYYVPGLDGTPCLFKMARSIHNNLIAVARKQPKTYFQLLERLLDMREVLKARTEKPYTTSFDTKLRQRLPKEALDYWPFSEYEAWVEDLRAHKKGRAAVQEPTPFVEKKENIAADDSQQAELEAAMLTLEENFVGLGLGSGLNDTPLVRNAVIALSTLTLKHIERQTGVTVSRAYEDAKLIKSTEIILYHSVFSVVLDSHGEPSTYRGVLEYPILVSPPGHVMERSLHPPGGLYISVRKYGDGAFKIENNKISKVLFGGIGGFVDNCGGDVRVRHAFQKKIQARLDTMGNAYAAAITAPAAFKSEELTISAVRRKFPVLVEATLPYAMKEIRKKAENLFENWEEVANQVGTEAIKQIIKAEVKEKIIKYLVKKIGAKFVPLINIASALYDFFEGEEERVQVRHALACIVLHVKGTSQDDLHIAAKVLAKILADRFEKAIIDALIKRAVKVSDKALTLRKRGSRHRGGDKPPEDAPSDQADPAKPKTSDAPADAPTDKPADTAKPADRPANPHQATDTPATGQPATGQPATDQRGTAKKGTGEETPADTKPQQKPEPKVEKKPDAETEAKPEVKPEPKAAKKPKEDEETGVETVSAERKKKKQADEDEGEEDPEAGKGSKRPKKGDAEAEEPDLEARGTDDAGTQNKGTGPSDADKKKAKAHRDRGKKIGIRATIKQRWGPSAAIILTAYGQRYRLRQAWAYVAPHLFAHHLVPVTVLKSHPVAQGAVVAGFDFNGKKNGALLNKEEHEGGHNEYNRLIAEEMDGFAAKNPDYSPKDARDFVESRIGDWKAMYLKGGEYVEDTSDPGTAKR